MLITPDEARRTLVVMTADGGGRWWEEFRTILSCGAANVHGIDLGPAKRNILLVTHVDRSFTNTIKHTSVSRCVRRFQW